MRAALALLALGLGLGCAMRADPARRTAIVDVDGVEVRAGLALGFPAVSQLHKGDSSSSSAQEETGFFAILPPPKFRELDQANSPRESRAGRKTAKPTSRRGRRRRGHGRLVERQQADRPGHDGLPKGTIVEVTGPAVRIDNASWFPIMPPEGDLRWIPKSALRAASLSALAPASRHTIDPESSPFTVAGAGGKLRPSCEAGGPETSARSDRASPVDACHSNSEKAKGLLHRPLAVCSNLPGSLGPAGGTRRHCDLLQPLHPLRRGG